MIRIKKSSMQKKIEEIEKRKVEKKTTTKKASSKKKKTVADNKPLKKFEVLMSCGIILNYRAKDKVEARKKAERDTLLSEYKIVSVSEKQPPAVDNSWMYSPGRRMI